jgi:hypothetical protein
MDRDFHFQRASQGNGTSHQENADLDITFRGLGDKGDGGVQGYKL